MLPAIKAVDMPITEIVMSVTGASTKSRFERATMYTPAVTIVAAWINADTGVGPAIASGSQVKRGICALLPTAPAKSRSVIKVTDNVPTGMAALLENISAKFKVPN